MLIRPATAADTLRLFSIWHASVTATHTFLAEGDFAFYARLVLETYLPHAPLSCAVMGDDIAGFIGVTAHEGFTAIDSLFISPAWFGHGIGRALLNHASTHHPGTLHVDVNAQNEHALGFYLHMGFTETARSPLDQSGRPYPIIHMKRSGAGAP